MGDDRKGFGLGTVVPHHDVWGNDMRMEPLAEASPSSEEHLRRACLLGIGVGEHSGARHGAGGPHRPVRALQLALRTALFPAGNFGRILAALRDAVSLATALDDPRRHERFSMVFLPAAHSASLMFASWGIVLLALRPGDLLRAFLLLERAAGIC